MSRYFFGTLQPTHTTPMLISMFIYKYNDDEVLIYKLMCADSMIDGVLIQHVLIQ